MNEKRKLHSDFINDKLITREREWASDLAAQIIQLIRTSPRIPADVLETLYNMLRQLEDTKSTQPKSILRSLEKKIKNFKQLYGLHR